MGRYKSSSLLFISTILIAWSLQPLEAALPSVLGWRTLDSGFSVVEIDASRQAPSGSLKITVLKIDPRWYSFKVLSSTEHDSVNLTAKEWCRSKKFVAAVNAGMYAKDFRTHIGYLKNYSHVNNPRVQSNYKAMLAFNPKTSAVPAIQIYDLTCRDLASFKNQYNTLVQSIRMVSCTRENVWSNQNMRSSIACMAMDSTGKALILFSESPCAVHDFIDALLSLPLAISTALYLEGGAPASLYVSLKGTEISRNGVYEMPDETHRTFSFPQSLPHVIGVARKK
jgi:uncharacterized protein YigE (DUF2233 family)